MQDIIKAIEEASVKIKELIETGDTGKSEQENSTGDTQLKLDIASDVIIEDIFKTIPSIKAIVSEEQEEIVNLNENGKYLIAYDPLDGSSLVDVNLSVGSIYGIYKDNFDAKSIIASVYVVFGPRVEMVVAIDDVKMYRLKKDKFEFIQTITLDEKGKLNAPGSTQNCWAPYHKELIDDVDTYAGIMVAYNSVGFDIDDPAFENLFDTDLSGIVPGVYLGARYHFTDNLGAFLELGYGVSAVNLGLTVRFD